MIGSRWKGRRVFLCSSILVLAICLGGAKAESLSLGKAVEMALANNKEILILRERVEEAEQGVKEARAGYWPVLDLSGTYTRLDKAPSLDIPGMGTIEMGKRDNYLSKLSFTQPLYTSGRLSYGYKAATFNYQKALKDLENGQNRIVLEVRKAFYSNLLARKNVEVVEKALEQAERHLGTVQDLFRAGVVSRFDLLRAKVEVANLKPDLIKVKNGLHLSREGLANLVSFPLDSVELEGELTFETVEITLKEAIEQALGERGDLASLKLQRKMAEISLELAKVQNSPSLVLLGTYQYKKPFQGEDEWGGEWNLNLALSVPLFDGGMNRARVAGKRSELRQIELSLEQLEQGVILEVKSALWEMKAAEESIRAQEENIEQAEEALSIAEAQYKSGLITNLEVLDAQLALTRVRVGYLKALYDYNIAKAELEKAIK
jgi:outer membrane protein TolC